MQFAVPDPCVPSYLLAEPQRPSKLARNRQRDTRADILAVGRNMIAQGGFKNVRMAQIADHCSIAMQTIYNLVGSRRQLIADAVNEHIALSTRGAVRLTSFPNPLLAFTEAHWSNACKNPSYMSHATIDMFTGDMRPLIQGRQAHLMGFELRRQKAKGILRPNVLVTDLSEALVALVAHATLQWATKAYTDDELRRKLVVGQASLLLGAMTEPHAKELESWLSGYLARLH